jgi:hypothetical protein
MSVLKAAVVVVMGALVVFFALTTLGLVTISGSGRPVVRYQSQDLSAGTEPRVWSFDDLDPGSLPAGAEVLSESRFGEWAVREEPGAPSPPNALCQMGMAEFPSVALSAGVYVDLVMSTRFKPISGRVDQAAGLIFRIQDKDNYYILRANALEGNVNFYKYASGRRSALQESAANVVANEWQELRVEVVGTEFRGYLNGRQVVEASDDAYPAGRVGLWTKADSVTCFDDVEVKAL